MKVRYLLLALLSLLLTPAIASANAGTPLLQTGILHLFLGNSIIGIFEGYLLSWFFKVPRRRAIYCFVVANYLSAWIGYAMVGSSIIRSWSSWANVTIENLHIWFWIFVAFSFLITLVFEYPFVFLAFWKQPKAFQSSVKAIFLIHSISYILLFGIYSSVSNFSLLSQLDVVLPEQLQPPTGHAVYFLSSDGTQVLQSDLQGSSPETVKAIAPVTSSSNLEVQKDASNQFNLVLRRFDRQDTEELILEDFAALAAPIPERVSWRDVPIPRLTNKTQWEYFTGFWALEGIRGENQQANQRFHFALETPIVVWPIRNATHLEGDWIVFELGYDQICLLQPQTRKIALLARGRRPVVAKI